MKYKPNNDILNTNWDFTKGCSIEMKKQYGIYEVEESFQEDGLWKGYTCSVALAEGKQGKLYIKSDGRENYQSPHKPKDEELEI